MAVVIRLNVNEQLWTARWISRGINVILPLCDDMLDVLCIYPYVMRDERKESLPEDKRKTEFICHVTAA